MKKMDHRCPICGHPLVWQAVAVPNGNKPGMQLYPNAREDINSNKLVLPMRCPKCVINLTVRVDPEALENDVDEDE